MSFERTSPPAIPPIPVPSPSDEDVPLLGRSPVVAQVLSPQGLHSDDPRPPIAQPQSRRSNSWYTPHNSARRGEHPLVGPLPPGFQPQSPVYVPMPPGPTVVQIPEFDTLTAILREHRMAQLAAVDQQRELMRFMRGLNDWLARDVQDRQAELRAVTARIDQLREDLNRSSTRAPPALATPQPQVAGQGGGDFFVPPPGVPPIVPSGHIPGFVPQVGPYNPFGLVTPGVGPQFKFPVMPETQQLPRRASTTIPGSSRWDTDLPPKEGDHTGPVHSIESPCKRHLPPSNAFIPIMHALVVVISIILALSTFARAEPIQITDQDGPDSAMVSLASVTGPVFSHGTTCDRRSPALIIDRAAASYFRDELSAASVDGVHEGLSDVPKSLFTASPPPRLGELPILNVVMLNRCIIYVADTSTRPDSSILNPVEWL